MQIAQAIKNIKQKGFQSFIYNYPQFLSSLKRSKLIQLHQGIVLNDKQTYFIYFGSVDIYIKSGDDSVKYSYTQGQFFKLLRGQIRKFVGWSHNTKLISFPSVLLSVIDKSTFLSMFPNCIKEHLSIVGQIKHVIYNHFLIPPFSRSQYVYIILKGQFSKISQSSQAILPAGQDMGMERLIGNCFGYRCLQNQAKVLRIPVKQIERALQSLPLDQKDKIQTYLLKSRMLFQNNSRKKNFRISNFVIKQKMNKNREQCFPPILANSHMLLRIKIRKPVLRSRKPSLSNCT